MSFQLFTMSLMVLVLAVMFPAWMKFVMHHDVMRFAQFAVRVWGDTEFFSEKPNCLLQGLPGSKQFLISIGYPVRFAGSDGKKEDIPSW